MQNKFMDIDKGVNSRSTTKLGLKWDFSLHVRTSKALKTCFTLLWHLKLVLENKYEGPFWHSALSQRSYWADEWTPENDCQDVLATLPEKVADY